MPTKKIEEEKKKHREACYDPDHSPPTMMVYEPGLYEHECPTCHRKVTFRVNEFGCFVT